jgi:HlyD family secretion protein
VTRYALAGRMKRALYFLAALVVVGGLVFIVLREEPVPVEVASVTRGDLEVTLREEGRTRVQERYVIAAPLDGFLHRIDLEPGDEVRAGETILAQVVPLAPALLDARSVALAEARVDASSAALAAAEERAAAARALLGAAEEDLERRRRGGEAVSAQSVADARREVLFHSGEVASARATIAVAAADLMVARAALLAAGGGVGPWGEGAGRPATEGGAKSGGEGRDGEGASAQGSGGQGTGGQGTGGQGTSGQGMGDHGVGGDVPRPTLNGASRRAPQEAADALVLRAPIDGRVLAVSRESAGPVRLGEALLELADVRELEVVADYLTTEAVRMAPGMEARAVDWGAAPGGETIPLALRVRRVEPAARTKVSALGVEEQRVDVVLDLVDARAAGLALGDGFRVQVEVVVSRATNVLLVPEAALVRDGVGWSVFVVDGDRVTSTAVEIGRRDGRRAEVLGGVGEGVQVVVYPSERLVTGARVERLE